MIAHRRALIDMGDSNSNASSTPNATNLLLALLVAADDLHSAKSELNACLKQGFFNITKARLSSNSGGHTSGITVLDAREEVRELFVCSDSVQQAHRVWSIRIFLAASA